MVDMPDGSRCALGLDSTGPIVYDLEFAEYLDLVNRFNRAWLEGEDGPPGCPRGLGVDMVRLWCAHTHGLYVKAVVPAALAAGIRAAGGVQFRDEAFVPRAAAMLTKFFLTAADHVLASLELDSCPHGNAALAGSLGGNVALAADMSGGCYNPFGLRPELCMANFGRHIHETERVMEFRLLFSHEGTADDSPRGSPRGDDSGSSSAEGPRGGDDAPMEIVSATDDVFVARFI
jgi:hypothetical protein